MIIFILKLRVFELIIFNNRKSYEICHIILYEIITLEVVLYEIIPLLAIE